VTAKPIAASMLTEDQVTALKMAKAREDLRARQECHKKQEEERAKRGFFKKNFF
jgi:hypothetical protein